jgi:DNA-binding NarL/FixJ family response regulator
MQFIMIKVLIVDDSAVYREGLRAILEQDNEIEIAGSAANGIEALEFCRKSPPDLVLMDIRMPFCDGVEGTRLIKETNSNIRILILSTFDNDEYVIQALKNGADGYILKGMGDEDLVLMTKITMKGLGMFQQKIVQSVKEHLNNSQEPTEPVKETYLDLTDQESEILRWIVDGKTNKEIARLVFLAEGTIRNIISTLLSKLELNDRTQLAIYAIKNKLV